MDNPQESKEPENISSTEPQLQQSEETPVDPFVGSEQIFATLNQVLEPAFTDLLQTVEKRGYFHSKVEEFNPMQYLAQYLMRNNPKYKYK